MPDGRTYKNHRYDDIIEEQVYISYMSKGSISIAEIDNLCPYDRKLIAKILKNIKEQELQQYNKLSSSSRTSRY